MTILTLVFPDDHCPHCFADTGRSQRIRDRTIYCEECGHVQHTRPYVKVDTDTVPIIQLSKRQAE